MSKETFLTKLVYFGLEFFGKYYSTYHGIVIDNDDPEKMNRVKVIFPQITDVGEGGIWARPKGSWGGKDYGFNLLPNKGDLVYLEFSSGDLEYPIWQHSSFGKDEKPEEFSSNKIYGFKTPNGNIILIDDSDDNGSILVKHKTSNEYIKITENELQLEANLIKLGEGKEPVILGDTHIDLLKQLISTLNNLTGTLATHTHPGNSTPSTQAPQISSIKGELSSISGKLSKSLSKKVKTD